MTYFSAGFGGWEIARSRKRTLLSEGDNATEEAGPWGRTCVVRRVQRATSQSAV